MPVTILKPTGDGSENTWALPGGAGFAKWQGVLPPDDADTTYIQQDHLTGTSTQTCTCEDLPAAAAAVVTHTLRHRMRRSTTLSPPSYCNGVLKLAADILGPTIGGAYWNRRPETYYSDFLTTDTPKVDLSAWTVANVNAAEIGVRLAGLGASENIHVTSVDWAVTWDPVANPILVSFSMFVGSIIGPVIGAALTLRDVSMIAQRVYRRSNGKHRILPREYASLLASFRAPHRIYA